MSATRSDRVEREEEEEEEERIPDPEPEERDRGRGGERLEEERNKGSDEDERDGGRQEEERHNGRRASDERPPSSFEELECKICYQRYSLHGRRPKLLCCLHRVCARCLCRMLDLGSAPGCVSCPFCRHPTPLGQLSVAALPDDANLVGRLALCETARASWGSEQREVLLMPHGLAALHGSTPSPIPNPTSSPTHDSSCLIITILEVQRDGFPARHDDDGLSISSSLSSEASLDAASLGSVGGPEQERDVGLAKLCCAHVPRALVWLLGFFYFGSLPLGIYLLVLQRVTLGIVSVSLVPASLTVCLVYGFCQCLCQGLCDCSTRT